MPTIGDTTAITFGGGVSGNITGNLFVVPGTNIMYFLNTAVSTRVYYADFTDAIAGISSTVTPTQVNVEASSQSDYVFICYGLVSGTKTLFVCVGSPRNLIFSLALNNDGTPSAGPATQLANSTSVSSKTQIACDSTYSLLYVITNYTVTPGNPLQVYNLNTNTYLTALTTGGTSIDPGTITDLIYTNGSVYINTVGPLFKGALNSVSNPTTVTTTNYLANIPGRDGAAIVVDSFGTAYITYIGTGGQNSRMYKVDNFYTTKSSSALDPNPFTLVNGMYFLGLSKDESYVLISNRDSGTSGEQILVTFVRQLPCLVAGIKILTPSGYIPVEELHPGDLIITPDGQQIPIVDVFQSEVIGTKDNIPYRIPAHYFEQDRPNEDIVLSPAHAVFYKEWVLPVWLDNLQREENLIGEKFTYYHIELPDYKKDKLVSHNLPIDSFDKTSPEPL